MEMGGKRLRPVLLLAAYNIFSDDVVPALPAALGIEVFHNFTLLHDDIMDKAEVRRNRPTVHRRYSENSAILSGDAMAFLSYKYLLECKSTRMEEVIDLFSATALEVCEGQQYDMEFEDRLDVSEEEYLEMIRLKTAVLLACSLKSGALLANADDQTANALYDYGQNLGLTFQIQDDLLDTFGDQKTFGKRIGGDIVSNKKTWLLVKALEETGQLKESLLKWINSSEFQPEQKIAAVKEIFIELGIEKKARNEIDRLFQKSSAILNELPVADKRKKVLQELSHKMLKRNS